MLVQDQEHQLQQKQEEDQMRQENQVWHMMIVIVLVIWHC